MTQAVKHRWRETTRTNPCPSCKRSGWCQVSDAGLSICRRLQQPGAAERRDRNGGVFYLWRPDSGSAFTMPPPLATRPAGAKRAELDTLDRVYRAFLSRLALTQAHREALHKRGLEDAAIDAGAYRSMPGQERWRIARDLAGMFPGELLTVPGFYLKQQPARRPYPSIAGAGPGILIPCRDTQERIVALKLRHDEVRVDEPRYTYLSSKRHDGPGPGSPPHVPLGITAANAGTLRITEGELKSDVAWRLSHVPTISAPGVGNWRPCLPVICELRPHDLLIAFDADWQTKEEVRRPLVELLRVLIRAGFNVALELWDEAQGKGIDDLLAAGGRPEIRWMGGTDQ